MVKLKDGVVCVEIPQEGYYYINETYGIIGLDEQIPNISNEITNDILYYYNYSKEIITSDSIIEIYDTSNPHNNSNVSLISLGECENTLRSYYHISSPLIIYAIETNSIDISYSVFDMNGNQLNLSLCEEVGIDLYVPIKTNSLNLSLIDELMKEGINVFNKSDPFFNDICVTYDNDDSVGLPFSMRKELYVDSLVCSIGCELISIDVEQSIANCKCGLKEALSSNIKNKFTDTILNSNFFVIKCAKLVFECERIRKNIGFFTFLFLFFVK